VANDANDASDSRGATPDDALGDDFSARLAALRALLSNPPEDDTIAERYNELLESARGHEARLAALRLLGAELRALQDSGDLPRTMIARAPRRPTRPGTQ
jgi:hypothetical protein